MSKEQGTLRSQRVQDPAVLLSNGETLVDLGKVKELEQTKPKGIWKI